jgi:hypothetical protein
MCMGPEQNFILGGGGCFYISCVEPSGSASGEPESRLFIYAINLLLS